MTGPSFRDAELEGWDRKAGYWDDSLGTVTLSAIDPLLDSVEAVVIRPGEIGMAEVFMDGDDGAL